MDFSLNEVQKMLQDSASKFIQNDYDFETRQHYSKCEVGFNPDNWGVFAELGWLALPFEEKYGGLDGSLVDLVVLHTELGKGLITEPFMSTVILSGNIIQRHGTEKQKEQLLTKIIAGEMKLALASTESDVQHDITRISTVAKPVSDGYMIDGFKSVVLSASVADKIIVVARTSGELGDTEGLSLFLVDPEQSGVIINSYPTNDGGLAADITLQNVLVSSDHLLGETDTAYQAIKAVLNDAIVVISAEAVGAMEKLLHSTVEFTKVRQQFGEPISNFQVLQHCMVDMFVEYEQAKSMLYFGAINIKGSDKNSNKAVAMLKIKIGNAGKIIGQSSVQLHGGMGITDELDIGHFFKRLTMINTSFGSNYEHLDYLVKQQQKVA